MTATPGDWVVNCFRTGCILWNSPPTKTDDPVRTDVGYFTEHDAAIVVAISDDNCDALLLTTHGYLAWVYAGNVQKLADSWIYR